MKKTLLALLLALMLTAAPALAIPSPSDDFYILDEANVISNATEEYIIYNNDQLADACGAQIVFAVVDDTEGEAIDDYAYDLAKAWGIGDSSKDNGFLVLMAIDDDNYYALPGTGLERAISAGTVKDLLDNYLEPDFAAKDYDSGARKLFDVLFEEICDASAVSLTAGMPSGSASTGQDAAPERELRTQVTQTKVTPSAQRRSGFPIGTVVVVIIILVILVAAVSSSGRRRRRGSVPPPPPHVPPRRRPIIIPRINLGPRPGNGPRPQNRQHNSRPGGFGGGFGGGASRSGGGGRSFGGGAGRSGGSFRSSGRSGGGFSRGGRSGGGGSFRGGGAGRGR